MKKLAILAITLLALLSIGTEPSPEPPPSLGQKIKHGTFDLHWGLTKYRMTLEKDGVYRSGNDDFAVWVGSWSINEKDNVFTITETTTPNDPFSWATYEMTIDPKTAKGKVTGATGKGIEVAVVPNRDAPPLKKPDA